jgi:hypothetical protein
MKTQYLILIAPLILTLDIYMIGFIFEFLSAPSDIGVFVGVICGSIFLVSNYVLIKYFINQIKNKINENNPKK